MHYFSYSNLLLNFFSQCRLAGAYSIGSPLGLHLIASVCCLFPAI